MHHQCLVSAQEEGMLWAIITWASNSDLGLVTSKEGLGQGQPLAIILTSIADLCSEDCHSEPRLLFGSKSSVSAFVC